MKTEIRTQAKVDAAHRIEIAVPGLPIGADVEVVVTPRAPESDKVEPATDTRPSIFDIIEGLKGHRHFQTAEEVDAYIREERDSWDR
jgi:hypothetical protein